MKRIYLLFLALIAIFGLQSEDLTWGASPYTTISSVIVDSFNPLVGIADDGTIVVAWIEGDPMTGGSLKAQVRSFDGMTVTSHTLSATSTVTEAVMCVDPSGNATVVWIEGGTAVNTQTYKTATTTWSATAVLSTLEVGTPSQVQIGLDRSGTVGSVAVVWINTVAGPVNTILYREKVFTGVGTENGTWFPNIILAPGQVPTSITPLANPGAPQVALGTGSVSNPENIVIIYHDNVDLSLPSLKYEIFTSQAVFGGAFSTPQVISDYRSGFQYRDPQVAFYPSADGLATAVWFRYKEAAGQFSEVSVQVTQQNPNIGATAWDPATDLVFQGEGIVNPDDLSLRIACTEDGNRLIVWNTSFNNSTYAVQSAFNTTLIDIVRQNRYALSADLAVDSQSNAVVVFPFYRTALLPIVALSVDGELTAYQPGWGYSSSVAEEVVAVNGFPRVAISYNTGTTTVQAASVFLHNETGTVTVALNTATGTLVNPPVIVSGIQETVDYGIYIDHQNTITWNPSAMPNNPPIIKYLIYREGIVIGQVSASGTPPYSFTDYNQPATTVNYGIVGVNDQSNQSNPATVAIP